MSVVYITDTDYSHLYICKRTFKILTNLLNLLFLYVAAVGLPCCGIKPNESAVLFFPLLYIYGISVYQYIYIIVYAMDLSYM